MVEWFKAAVLKTAGGQPPLGSNPSSSAIFLSFPAQMFIFEQDFFMPEICNILCFSGRNPATIILNEKKNTFSKVFKGYTIADIKIEDIDATSGSVTTLREPDNRSIPSSIIIARIANNVKPNSSKVVDENGEPLVVYHGTDAEFTVIDTQVEFCEQCIEFLQANRKQTQCRWKSGDSLCLPILLMLPKMI